MTVGLILIALLLAVGCWRLYQKGKRHRIMYEVAVVQNKSLSQALERKQAELARAQRRLLQLEREKR